MMVTPGTRAQLEPASDAPPSRIALGNMSLARKVALIPALTLLLLGLMLTVATRMGERNTIALRALDRDVFEPLNLAQMLKDETTLLHTRIFALLSIGINETNPAAQTASADAVLLRLDAETANFNRLLAANSAVPPVVAARLRKEFDDYASRARDTVSFAAYDASYGALLAGVTGDKFDRLHADLDALVRSLAERRAALASDAVANSLTAQTTLLGLGIGATMLVLLGSGVVGRSIARPVQRLTAMMKQLAAGDTDTPVPGTERGDEVGAMAHAVEVFRANLIARRQAEVALQHTNLQFDAALSSMLQGMIVWGADQRLQLVNRRFYAMTGMPEGCLVPGMPVRQAIGVSFANGLHPGETLDDVCEKISLLLATRRSAQFQMEMRPGQHVQIAIEPMTDGGAVATFEDITEKRQSEAQIVFMARHDALTGLPNRVMFQEHLAAMLGNGGDSQPFAVMCLDLDHFKEVNDTLGHPAGDELLRLVAGRLRQCVREHDLIARLGGDEFAVVAASRTDGLALATALAHRLVASIGAPYDVKGHNIVIGTSIGIALSEPGLSGADLMKRADVSLYKAKEERGTFVFFEAGMEEQLQARLGMEADLRTALHRGEFELNYQPLYNLIENRVTAFEALIRWNSPTRGRVPPENFIPLAEQTGLIMPIGEWVLRTACAEAARWPDHVRVAVNLSPVQTRHKNLVPLVRTTLEQTGLPARRLELEITETVLLQDTETVMTMLESLHSMSVKVSMDDFGTGYSSLSYLRRFPFDKIKIDRSFIGDLRGTADGSDSVDGSPGTLAAAANSASTIVRAIIGLGDNLGISTTAEGVETAQQFAQVRQKGCTEVQGFFISPPRPASEVAELLLRLDQTLPAIANSRGASPQLAA
ncbi:MAG TPA: EAL domain-containing protein [Acetobacteraceae bacterium]|jgi:diguanylate cyclase (GGDEF)-like protein|nr:EAL domain-containing protein [Acetobacteraceae bacterium]